jgi:hypothetical protein
LPSGARTSRATLPTTSRRSPDGADRRGRRPGGIGFTVEGPRRATIRMGRPLWTAGEARCGYRSCRSAPNRPGRRHDHSGCPEGGRRSGARHNRGLSISMLPSATLAALHYLGQGRLGPRGASTTWPARRPTRRASHRCSCRDHATGGINTPPGSTKAEQPEDARQYHGLVGGLTPPICRYRSGARATVVNACPRPSRERVDSEPDRAVVAGRSVVVGVDGFGRRGSEAGDGVDAAALSGLTGFLFGGVQAGHRSVLIFGVSLPLPGPPAAPRAPKLWRTTATSFASSPWPRQRWHGPSSFVGATPPPSSGAPLETTTSCACHRLGSQAPVLGVGSSELLMRRSSAG